MSHCAIAASVPTAFSGALRMEQRDEPVAQFAPFASLVAVAGDRVVVARDDDDAPLVEPAPFERVDEPREATVCVLRDDQVVFRLLVRDAGFVERAFELAFHGIVARHGDQLGVKRAAAAPAGSEGRGGTGFRRPGPRGRLRPASRAGRRIRNSSSWPLDSSRTGSRR